MSSTKLNKTIVISGGASGIGLAATKKFLTEGFNVCVLDHNKAALEQLSAELIVHKNQLLLEVCDITESKNVSLAMDKCLQKFGTINAVLPAAGIVKDGYFIKVDRNTGKVKEHMSQAQFADVVNVNLTGTFNTIQQAAIRMIDNKFAGVLYLVSSINQSGQLGQLNYSSTKHALAMWPKLLVGEFHKQNIDLIRVVGIAPGYVDTPILKDLKPIVRQSIINDIAIGRLIQTDEIVSTIWHIWQNKAINATTIEISGGTVQRGVCK
ncbi:MAG: SDR family NAD(P)-dependent oxidoreductase [Alcanivoracaceae bacterium]|nr:SDR family NAD(P)-dependent oxidoreductase [Alcanivoracaceae bacterium]